MAAAEKEALLRSITEQLEQIKSRNLLELADRLEVEVTMKIDNVHETFQKAQRRILELKEHIADTRPPQVSVLGG